MTAQISDLKAVIRQLEEPMGVLRKIGKKAVKTAGKVGGKAGRKRSVDQNTNKRRTFHEELK